MNSASFESYMSKAIFGGYKNSVEAEKVRIESDYYFLSPFQTADYPKERDSNNVHVSLKEK